MQNNARYYILLFCAMAGAYLLSSTLISSLFIGATPRPVWGIFSAKLMMAQEQFVSSAADVRQSFMKQFLSTERKTPGETPIAPTSIVLSSSQQGFFDTLPAPPAPLAPTSTPLPTQPIPPTLIPTQRTIPTVRPTGNVYLTPISRPTTQPTQKPQPTAVPKPTKPPLQIDFPKVVGDPLKQKWYANGSLACYTTERFIEVYAEGLTPNSCYNNIRAHMDKSIVSTSLLGRSIQVHKKALPAFEAVAKTLDQYKVDSSTYKFPSKTYKIKNVGAYIFRCNVNASTSGKADTCSTGCKLSPHAFGIGVDINYDENCNGCKNYDMPKEISDTFEMYGFRWGGHYPLIGSYIDAMHFEYMRDLCEGV